jgi:hypothetical protein
MSIKASNDRETIREIADRTHKIVQPHCGGYKMAAYQEVAAVMGVSASWLRKFIRYDGTPEPSWSEGCALMRFYKNLCRTVDDVNVNERSRIEQYQGEINALDDASRNNAGLKVSPRFSSPASRI